MDLLFYQNLLPDENMDLETLPAYADKTYALLWQRGHIKGFTSGLASIQQRIYKILATEKGVFPVYSSDYGLVLDDLFGQDYDLVESELQRRIEEALDNDDDIAKISDFAFSRQQNQVCVSFKVTASNGQGEQEIDWRFNNL